jgi:SnoaL-like domain
MNMTTLSASDRLEILDLCARYYISTDEKDVDGFMDCWVPDEDIVFNSAFGNFKGRAAVRAFEDEHVHRGMAIGKRHLLSNVSIRPGSGANQALVTSYLTVVEVVDVPQIIATAIYRDSLVEKTDAGWKFRQRSMDVDPGFQKVMGQQSAHS